MDNFLSVPEFAKILNVSKNTVLRLIRQGRIKAVDVGTKSKSVYRILDKELERFIAENYDATDITLNY